jgi:hypothetical protein
MTPTRPFQIPEVLSLAFWGAVWAVLLLPLLVRWDGSWIYWVSWLLAGALGPSVVALFVVMPLKGHPVAGGWSPQIIVGALLLNGAWGLGTAAIIRLLRWLQFS